MRWASGGTDVKSAKRGQAILSVARFRQPGGRGQKRPPQEKAAAVRAWSIFHLGWRPSLWTFDKFE